MASIWDIIWHPVIILWSAINDENGDDEDENENNDESDSYENGGYYVDNYVNIRSEDEQDITYSSSDDFPSRLSKSDQELLELIEKPFHYSGNWSF